MEVLAISPHAPKVKRAIDQVINAAGIKSANGLARRLDVSKQAMSKWRTTGYVPPLRALQMEMLADSQVTWRQLLPDIAEKAIDEF